MFLQGLEVKVYSPQLQAGVRQYLHRMIICLGDELLQYVPMAVSLLLKDCKVLLNETVGVSSFIIILTVTGDARLHSTHKSTNCKVQRKNISISSECLYASSADHHRVSQ